MKKIELPGFGPNEAIPLKATVKSIALVREKRLAHEKNVRRMKRRVARTSGWGNVTEILKDAFFKGQ